MFAEKRLILRVWSVDDSFSIALPDAVPGMTLPEVVLFPQATLPLFIFEPRYRKMLGHILERDRLMLIATQDQERARSGEEFEPFHSSATLGLVQNSQKNEDGTSSILVQGLIRVNVVTTCQEDPFRVFGISPIDSEPGAPLADLDRKSDQMLALVRRRSELGGQISREMLRFFEKIEEPEILCDLISHTLITDTSTKLDLLGMGSVARRIDTLVGILRNQVSELSLNAKLKGGLPDDRISWN